MDIKTAVYGSVFLICFISQIISTTLLPRATFRCENKDALRYVFSNDYISGNFFCDGEKDCSSGKDEGFGCNLENNVCGEGKFFCDQNECKNISVRCNTIKDCQDGTDELHCGDEVDVKNCSKDEKFLCRDGLRCLALEYTCDGICNCFDCSDENSNCLEHDEDLFKKCPHAYIVTANGPQCLCNTTNSNSSSNTMCDHVQDCTNSGKSASVIHYIHPICEQRCVTFGHRKHCSCFVGYMPLINSSGSRCVSNVGFVVLFTDGNEIQSHNNTQQQTSLVLGGITNCTGVTAANQYVYYVTSSRDKKTSIFKASLSSGTPEKLIETDFDITSIAVDYITNNVYFTGNGSLSVCTNDGRICKQLKCCGISYVSLAPKWGLMFYIQAQQLQCQNASALMRSNMDGSNETIFTDGPYRGDVSIEVDESISMIYLLERRAVEDDVQLFKISLDSSFKEDIFVYSRMHRFSSHGDEIFFTMTTSPRSIYHFGNHSSTEWADLPYFSNPYLRHEAILSDLYVYNPAIQRSEENPCNQSSCSGLCLVKREGSPSASAHFLSHTCICERFTPTGGNHWCEDDFVHAANRRILWISVGIVVVIILGILGLCLWKKRSWYGYYSTLQQWQRSKRDQRIITSDGEE